MPDDERIRGVLDLGDSAPAAKRLNEEVERLLKDLEKLNAEFGAKGGDTAKFIDSQNKIRAEIDKTRESANKLSGGGGGGDGGFEKLTRGIFGFERAASSLVSGTGLGRAAGILEGVIGMVGGPAGLGFGVGLLANTLDNVLPKIFAGFQKLTTGIDPEKTAEIKQQLAEVAAAYRSFVEQMEAKAKPGSEEEQGFIASRLARMFNIKTLTGRGGIEQGLLSAALRKEISDMKRQEIDEIADLRAQRKAAVEAPAGLGGNKADVARLDKEIDAIEQAAASRTRDKLLREASLGPDNPAGRTALQQLRNLAAKHPEWGGKLPRMIDEILSGAFEGTYRPPVPEVVAHENEERVEQAQRALERSGSASRRAQLQALIDRGGEEFIGPPAPRGGSF